jgi:hypothetical protein
MLWSLLAEDFVITSEDGSIYSRAGYISHRADPSTKVQVAELSDLKVGMHGDTTVGTGACHERGESSGKPFEHPDRLADIWMKAGGQWQLVASQYSVLPDSEPASRRGRSAQVLSVSPPRER